MTKIQLISFQYFLTPLCIAKSVDLLSPNQQQLTGHRALP